MSNRPVAANPTTAAGPGQKLMLHTSPSNLMIDSVMSEGGTESAMSSISETPSSGPSSGRGAQQQQQQLNIISAPNASRLLATSNNTERESHENLSTAGSSTAGDDASSHVSGGSTPAGGAGISSGVGEISGGSGATTSVVVGDAPLLLAEPSMFDLQNMTSAGTFESNSGVSSPLTPGPLNSVDQGLTLATGGTSSSKSKKNRQRGGGGGGSAVTPPGSLVHAASAPFALPKNSSSSSKTSKASPRGGKAVPPSLASSARSAERSGDTPPSPSLKVQVPPAGGISSNRDSRADLVQDFSAGSFTAAGGGGGGMLAATLSVNNQSTNSQRSQIIPLRPGGGRPPMKVASFGASLHREASSIQQNSGNAAGGNDQGNNKPLRGLVTWQQPPENAVSEGGSDDTSGQSLAPKSIRPEPTTAEMAVLLYVFRHVDEDEDGFINFHELSDAVAHLGWPVSASELGNVCAEIEEQQEQQAANRNNTSSSGGGHPNSVMTASMSSRPSIFGDSTLSRQESGGFPTRTPRNRRQSLAAVLTKTYNFGFFTKVVESLQNSVRLETFEERPEVAQQHIIQAQKTKCLAPDGAWRWFWNVGVVITTVYLMISIGFGLIWRESDVRYDNRTDDGSIVMNLLPLDIIVTLIMIADLFVNLLTTYVRNEEFIKVFVDEPVALLKYRIRTIEFWCDFLAALPLFIILRASEDPTTKDVGAWLSFLRLAKIHRIEKLFSAHTGFATLSHSYITKYFVIAPVLSAGLYLVTLIHLSAILFIYIQQEVGQARYAAALFQALYIISTVGFGDVEVDTQSERIYLSFLFAVGMVVNAIVIGSSISFIQRGNMTTKQHEKMVALDTVLNFFEIPRGLADEVRQFQSYLSFNNLLDTHESLVQNLPDDIRINLDLFAKIRAITTVPFLHHAPASVKLGLAHVLRQVSATPESTLVHSGAPGEAMYFLLYGFVSLYTHEGHYLSTLKEGHYFGEVALLTDDVDKQASCKALTYCLLFELKKEDFDLLADEFPKFKAKLVMESKNILAALAQMEDDEDGEDDEEKDDDATNPLQGANLSSPIGADGSSSAGGASSLHTEGNSYSEEDEGGEQPQADTSTPVSSHEATPRAATSGTTARLGVGTTNAVFDQTVASLNSTRNSEQRNDAGAGENQKEQQNKKKRRLSALLPGLNLDIPEEFIPSTETTHGGGHGGGRTPRGGRSRGSQEKKKLLADGLIGRSKTPQPVEGSDLLQRQKTTVGFTDDWGNDGDKESSGLQRMATMVMKSNRGATKKKKKVAIQAPQDRGGSFTSRSSAGPLGASSAEGSQSGAGGGNNNNDQGQLPAPLHHVSSRVHFPLTNNGGSVDIVSASDPDAVDAVLDFGSATNTVGASSTVGESTTSVTGGGGANNRRRSVALNLLMKRMSIGDGLGSATEEIDITPRSRSAFHGYHNQSTSFGVEEAREQSAVFHPSHTATGNFGFSGPSSTTTAFGGVMTGAGRKRSIGFGLDRGGGRTSISSLASRSGSISFAGLPPSSAFNLMKNRRRQLSTEEIPPLPVADSVTTVSPRVQNMTPPSTIQATAAAAGHNTTTSPHTSFAHLPHAPGLNPESSMDITPPLGSQTSKSILSSHSGPSASARLRHGSTDSATIPLIRDIEGGINNNNNNNRQNSITESESGTLGRSESFFCQAGGYTDFRQQQQQQQTVPGVNQSGSTATSAESSAAVGKEEQGATARRLDFLSEIALLSREELLELAAHLYSELDTLNVEILGATATELDEREEAQSPTTIQSQKYVSGIDIQSPSNSALGASITSTGSSTSPAQTSSSTGGGARGGSLALPPAAATSNRAGGGSGGAATPPQLAVPTFSVEHIGGKDTTTGRGALSVSSTAGEGHGSAVGEFLGGSGSGLGVPVPSPRKNTATTPPVQLANTVAPGPDSRPVRPPTLDASTLESVGLIDNLLLPNSTATGATTPAATEATATGTSAVILSSSASQQLAPSDDPSRTSDQNLDLSIGVSTATSSQATGESVTTNSMMASSEDGQLLVVSPASTTSPGGGGSGPGVGGVSSFTGSSSGSGNTMNHQTSTRRVVASRGGSGNVRGANLQGPAADNGNSNSSSRLLTTTEEEDDDEEDDPPSILDTIGPK